MAAALALSLAACGYTAAQPLLMRENSSRISSLAALVSYCRLSSESPRSDDGSVLSLKADSRKALLNGNEVALASAPFVRDGVFFIPLEEVTGLLGGEYSMSGDTVTVSFANCTAVYTIDSRSVSINGEAFEISGYRVRFDNSRTQAEIDDAYAPSLLQGVVFIPAGFTSSCRLTAGALPFDGVYEYPENDLVVIGGFKEERCIDGICINSAYDELPESLRASLAFRGEVESPVPDYTIEEYSSENLCVYVMRSVSKADMESMDGKVCAIKAIGGECSTPRGLRVGDSEERAVMLYGGERFTGFFSYELKEGAVSSYKFFTRYFGSTICAAQTARDMAKLLSGSCSPKYEASIQGIQIGSDQSYMCAMKGLLRAAAGAYADTLPEALGQAFEEGFCRLYDSNMQKCIEFDRDCQKNVSGWERDNYDWLIDTSEKAYEDFSKLDFYSKSAAQSSFNAALNTYDKMLKDGGETYFSKIYCRNITEVFDSVCELLF